MAICLEHNTMYNECEGGFCALCLVVNDPIIDNYEPPNWNLVNSNYLKEPLKSEWDIMKNSTKIKYMKKRKLIKSLTKNT